MFRLLFLLLIVLAACKSQSSDHPVFKYYPPNEVFEDGYVSKYYRHYYPKNEDSKSATEITYSKFRKDGHRIIIERYNAGFDLAGISEMEVTDAEINTKKMIDILRRDTLEIEIVNAVSSSWDRSNGEPFRLKYLFNDKGYIFTETQLSVSDTLIDGQPAKIFVTEGMYREEESGEIANKFTDTTTYRSGLGFLASKSDYENYRIETELMEQMSVDEFERRANHDKHRIAWIDPGNTLDSEEEFNICGHERFIADYYNSTPDGRYIYGKRALLDTIYNNLEVSKMYEQNGMIIFRFVVNCEGKAGRFTVDGYDFMYQPLKFEKETIDHLYSIIQKLDDWRPVVIAEEARDAYFYLTFKIDNGEITDILP
ncbi:MAG: hypothetical protein ABJG47_06785 [Ekhidna sp.]